MKRAWHKTKAGQKYYGTRTNVYLSNEITRKIIKIAGKLQMESGTVHSINDIVTMLVNNEFDKRRIYTRTKKKKPLSKMSYKEYRNYMNEAQKRYRDRKKEKRN